VGALLAHSEELGDLDEAAGHTLGHSPSYPALSHPDLSRCRVLTSANG